MHGCARSPRERLDIRFVKQTLARCRASRTGSSLDRILRKITPDIGNNASEKNALTARRSVHPSRTQRLLNHFSAFLTVRD